MFFQISDSEWKLSGVVFADENFSLILRQGQFFKFISQELSYYNKLCLGRLKNAKKCC